MKNPMRIIAIPKAVYWLAYGFILILPLVFYINFSYFIDSEVNTFDQLCQSISQKIPLSDLQTLQYESVQKEIKLRITQEHMLFVLRFSLIGAILGLVFINTNKLSVFFKGNNHILALVVWVAVIISSSLDIRMAFSVMIIGELGDWTRCLEGMLEDKLPGWETWIYQRVWNTPASIWMFVDRIFITWTLYIVAVCVSIRLKVLWQPISLFLIALSWFSFAIFSSYYYLDFVSQNHPINYILCIASVGIAVMVFACLALVIIYRHQIQIFADIEAQKESHENTD